MVVLPTISAAMLRSGDRKRKSSASGEAVNQRHGVPTDYQCRDVADRNAGASASGADFHRAIFALAVTKAIPFLDIYFPQFISMRVKNYMLKFPSCALVISAV